MIEKSDTFTAWIDSLADLHGRARILARIERLRSGNPGDVKSLGGGVSELRINYGPGYRVYFMRRGKVVYLLLCGGDKSSQKRDVTFAQAMAKQIKEQYS